MTSACLARAAIMAMLCAVSGCEASVVAANADNGIDQGTRRVIIAYLIAHGMAESYVTSGHATQSGLLQLVRSDHAALLAIRGQAVAPTWHALTQADGAVRLLISTTTVLDDGPRRASHARQGASRSTTGSAGD